MLVCNNIAAIAYLTLLQGDGSETAAHNRQCFRVFGGNDEFQKIRPKHLQVLTQTSNRVFERDCKYGLKMLHHKDNNMNEVYTNGLTPPTTSLLRAFRTTSINITKHIAQGNIFLSNEGTNLPPFTWSIPSTVVVANFRMFSHIIRIIAGVTFRKMSEVLVCVCVSIRTRTKSFYVKRYIYICVCTR